MSSSLPDGYTIRPATPEDASAVAELMNAAEGEETDELSSVDDVLHLWRGLYLAADTRLVVSADGEIAGAIATIGGDVERASIDAYVHPEHMGRGIGTALLELAEARARELLAGSGRVENTVLASNERAASLLARHGYRVAMHYLRMAIDLGDEPPPAPEWPAGLDPRPFEHGHAERFHAALEEAFEDERGHTGETFERWRERRLDEPSVDPTLWRAVWDGDEIAALIVVDRERFGMGWIGAVAVRRPWRTRGLGEALLRWAIRELHLRGERRVGLAVDSENPTGATRLYERVGMRVAWDAAVYEKELS